MIYILYGIIAFLIVYVFRLTDRINTIGKVLYKFSKRIEDLEKNK